jgi:hypothetical protein
MTHAHAQRQRTGQPIGCSQPGTETSCGQTEARPALAGLAVPAGGTPVIRRQKADAVTYAKAQGISIVVSKATVEDYVQDASKDKGLRKGLLDAWNLNASSQWLIDTPADLATGSDNPFHYQNFQEYQDFTKTTTGVSVDAFGGPVSAYFNRGAPKLASNAKNWGKTSLGDSYVEYIQGLRSGGMTDAALAQALLDLDDSVLASHLEKRAAAMMTLTVYLAEEWRKQGAAKIYRAILRLIVAGTRTFDDFLDDFAFIGSADAGRKQVGRFYDVWLGDSDQADLDSVESDIYGAMSPQRDEDYSSDEDMRTDDKKNLKSKRLFAQKYQ